ncbi:DUF6313 family protein [Streptomyces sp. NPDC058683]|uniref:DUF6313 family protein n=1 Tax=Streptomyces sp. NPDC058683 TaxID=3346597 RepID=UPI00365DCC1F
MTSLTDFYDAGGERKHFAEEFVQRAHSGNWEIAKDHWTRTVEHYGNSVQELEKLSKKEAREEAERLALVLCKTLAQAGKCWACKVGSRTVAV